MIYSNPVINLVEPCEALIQLFVILEVNMESAVVEIGRELGRFKSKLEWVNHAASTYKNAYKNIGCRDVITLDSATPRRVVLRGLQFENAHKDCTFPVIIYSIGAGND